MSSRNCLLIIAPASMMIIGCSQEPVSEPQPVFSTAEAGIGTRPVHDFIVNQGTYCSPDGSGGCALIAAPVPNYLCWCDPGTGWKVSLDYAAVAESWLHQESSGALSCGTECRGQVIEIPQPDGSARVSVQLQTRKALTWADKEKPSGLQLGTRADAVLRGKIPTLGQAKLELEFSIPTPGAPLPDLMQLLYDPAPGQQLHRIAFLGSAEGILRGKPVRLTIVQTGFTPVGLEDMPTGLPASVSLETLPRSHR